MKKVLFLFTIALFTVSSATANDFPTIDNDDVKVENVVEADLETSIDPPFGDIYYQSLIVNSEFLPANCTYRTSSGHTYAIMQAGSQTILSRYGPNGDLEARRVIDNYQGEFLCARANE